MKTTARAVCHHPGCNESTVYSYDSKKEAREGYKWRERWMCVRHSKPDDVLSESNMERTTTLEAKPVMTCRGDKVLGLFWNGSNGFAHGPGFKAFAKDFPEGTKLIVTARIELP